uniref:Uncharacterized protein n=1 Tax=Desertifilum tharense IPPAS B-1220 TaxID=1781255 RepID=A0ACD5H2D5_9CYAN
MRSRNSWRSWGVRVPSGALQRSRICSKAISGWDTSPSIKTCTSRLWRWETKSAIAIFVMVGMGEEGNWELGVRGWGEEGWGEEGVNTD